MSQQALLNHNLHVAVGRAVQAAENWGRGLAADQHLSSALQDKANSIIVRVHSTQEVLKASFPDAFAGKTDTGPNDGPVALVEEVIGGGVRLYIHGVLIRSVGAVEAPAVRRLKDMVNEAAQEGK